jgi:hypothetical protein
MARPRSAQGRARGRAVASQAVESARRRYSRRGHAYAQSSSGMPMCA